jgi:diadenosine tetraphosphate (Ap4A) HIT family hydrolase
MSECVFCRITAGEIPADLVVGNEESAYGTVRGVGVAESGHRVTASTRADAGRDVAHLHRHRIGGTPPGGMA